MSNANTKKQVSELEEDVRPEYNLTPLLKNAVRGKYAERDKQGTDLVLLDPAVAAAFPPQEAVNEALRLVMQLARIPAGREQPIA
ncbi:MAG: hypothetical protein U0350_18540 [Caldilineaceae bacterium]